MSPSEPPDLPGLPDRYRLGATLGTGGFGRVVKARDVVLDRDVAVKVLREPARDADMRRRFRREAQVTARVRHPHVVAVFDSGLLTDGSPYMVYEFVPGASLEDAAPEQVGPLPMVAAALAEALAAIHAAGAVHRDVKPANVLLRSPGDPVLLDLGIVRLEREGTPFTPEGILLGTPAYMAPELFAGGVASPASDQFAWAATLVHAAGGAVFRGRELREVLGEIKRHDPRACLPAALPEELRPILARALAPEPAGRFPDMARVGEELRAVASRQRRPGRDPGVQKTVMMGSPRRRPPTTGSLVAGRDTRRLPLARARGPALLATGLVAMGIGYSLQRPPPGPPTPAPRPAEGPAPLAEQLAAILPPDPLVDYTPPHLEVFLDKVYRRATDPGFPGRLSRALRAVEAWVAAQPREVRERPEEAVRFYDQLSPLNHELNVVVFLEERLRLAGPAAIFANRTTFLPRWDREAVRHLHLVVRAMVDASVCRLENATPPVGTLMPAVVMHLAKNLDLLHGGGEAAACPGAEARGARAFRTLVAEVDRVPAAHLVAYADLIRSLSRVEQDFRVLPSEERARGLDALERAVTRRLIGDELTAELAEILLRRAGLIRDSPEEDQAARLAEAERSLTRLAARSPAAIPGLLPLLDDDERTIFATPSGYDRFLAAVRAAAGS